MSAEQEWKEFANKKRYERIALTHGQSRPDIPLSSIVVFESYKSALRKAIEEREEQLKAEMKQYPENDHDYCLVRIAELQLIKRALDTVLP